MARGSPLIEATAVEKFYPAPDEHRIQVIAPLDITVYSGQILALLGPSGSGKSTLLRILTGLSKPSSGKVRWDGQDASQANLAIVFQGFALFPWLTVQENVEAPLEARGVPPAERAERSRLALDVVGLDGFEGAYPKELSGGMKQRVGFARALVVEPEVLFMDEPFSALDVLTAENLRSQVVELWIGQKLSTKAIFIVTHNIEEAVLLADRVIVLGKNPARIRADFEITLTHPRDRKSHPFVRYVDYIYQILTRPESEQHVPLGAPPAERQPAKYQMLPHVRPGGLAGLLEMLPQDGSRTDLYRLAEELGLEIDDILPIIEAGVLLGYVSVSEGDVQITETGRLFAEADILAQKDLFRDAAVKHVPLLDQIRRAVVAKRDHRVADDFFRDLLDEYFTEEELQRQLETAIEWGRYAELFDHDAEQKRFFLPEPETADQAGGVRE
jgi:NitT/TauT family transport system ATP-binding protein